MGFGETAVGTHVLDEALGGIGRGLMSPAARSDIQYRGMGSGVCRVELQLLCTNSNEDSKIPLDCMLEAEAARRVECGAGCTVCNMQQSLLGLGVAYVM